MFRHFELRTRLIAGTFVLAALLAAPAGAAMLNENFNTVTGTGGGYFLNGSGTSTLVDWDDGILGETAFGGALGHTHVRMSAVGNPTAGVGGSGAGVLTVSDLNFNMIDENFDSVTGDGGGVFLLGDGVTPNLGGGSGDWDTGIGGESAFFAAYDGAILVGDVSAQGLPGTDGAGQMIVNNVNVLGGGWYGGLAWQIPGFAPGSAAVLLNGSFDADGDMPFGGDLSPSGWTLGGDTVWLQGPPSWYGNVYVEGAQVPAYDGTHCLKMWCGWWAGYPNDAYVYQDLPAVEGQTWQLDCFTYQYSGDPLATENRAEMRIEFYNASDVLLDSAIDIILQAGDAMDTWFDNVPLQATAPAGTAYARAVLAYVSPVAPSGNCGAAFYDGTTFSVISGPPAIDLGNFSLTADVRGQANTGAGEVYGHYQLRLEDSNGNRLAFQSAAVADGNWHAIGGTLDTAIEMDAEGNPATGVFNPGSDTFTVVVGYDNQRTPAWGTGGTLEVDNLLMPNDNQAGSEYYAGMFWDLDAPSTDDPRDLTLSADLLGNVGGGNYQLRLEAYSSEVNVDEDFSTATGVGGVQLVYPGGTTGDSTSWDTGIENAIAFGGAINGVVTEPSGGIWITGTTTEGHPGGGAIVQAHEIALGSDGVWYVGLSWENQRLASTDLASVFVTADIKGTWNSGLLEQPGHYVLRVEDAQGDWIGFDGTTDGNWHTIGGALSNATASGDLGSGDGTFDVSTDGAYHVVVLLESGSINNWGGTLYIDNVSITPSPTPLKVKRGEIAFNGSANNAFQSVGGLLVDGESTWPDVGGYIQDGNDNWDRGIEGEAAFYGGYNASIGSMFVQGCTTCGMSGGGGGQFIASDIVHTASDGVYWAGAAWHGVAINMTDLTKVRLTGDVKGVWDTTGGTVAGKVVLRIEDNAENRLYFLTDGDGVWHHIGGTMNTATASLTNPPFNQTLGSYSIVVIIYTNDINEGPNATISFDNLRVEYQDPVNGWQDVFFENFSTVTGPTPGFLSDSGAIDSVTVTVTMEDGVATWGDVTCSGDVDGNGVVNLSDLAQLLGHYGITSGATREQGDLDGDGDIDLSDLAEMLSVYGHPC